MDVRQWLDGASGRVVMVTCPVCETGREQLDLVHRDVRDYRFDTVPEETFSVYACPGCGLLITPPDGENIGEYYPSGYGAHSPSRQPSSLLKLLDTGFKKHLLRLEPDSIDVLRSHLDKGHVLDVGCGNGEFLARCQNAGFTVEGCDISEAAVEATRSSYQIEARHGELHELGYERDAFDAIIFNHSFEHVDKPREYLKTVERIIAPNGYVLVNSPNPKSIEHRLLGEFWTDLDVPRHVYNYTPKALDDLFDQYRFGLIERRHTKSPRQLSASLSRYFEERYSVSFPTSAVFDLALLLPMIVFGITGKTGRMVSMYQTE